MESKTNIDISIDIPNYSGPLEKLLDLAKNQKVDLTKISVTILADHFLDFIKKYKDKNLDLTERETNLIIFIHEKKDVSVKDLQKNVWDYSANLETHTVETHIYRLRKKMKEIFGDENFIFNNNKGYSIN